MKKIVLGLLSLWVGFSDFTILGTPIEAIKHHYFVILAGGVGERLWPLSRQHKPKQFLMVGEQKTLLDQSIDRINSLALSENIWICTTQQHAALMQNLVGKRVGKIVIEPGSRNTGPAILLSCLEIYKQDPEAIVVFLPADPFIPTDDNAKFAQFLEHAIDFSHFENHITLLGVKPTYPATGYGYIEYEQKSDNQFPYKVKKFREKPRLEMAEEYIKSGNMLWNIGMFCGKVSTFMHEFKINSPDIYNGIESFMNGTGSYNDIKSDSIDYAVMEKSNNISVLPVDFNWCDVGNIEIFLSIKEQYGSLKKDNLFTVGSRNNLVDVPKKLVALIGVEDLCVVETDEVLLITKREDAEKVKLIVTMLKNDAFKEYL